MKLLKRVLRGGAWAVLSEVPGAERLVEGGHDLPRARSAPDAWVATDAVVTLVEAARQTQASERIRKGDREGYVSPTTIEVAVVAPDGAVCTLRHHGELLSWLRPREGDRLEVAYDPAADGFVVLATHAERAKAQIAWMKDLVKHGTESKARVLEVVPTGRRAHPNDPGAPFVAEHSFVMEATTRDARALRVQRRMWIDGRVGDEGVMWFREERPDECYAIFPAGARDGFLQALRSS